MCQPIRTPLRGLLLCVPAALAIAFAATDEADARHYAPYGSRQAVTGAIPHATAPAPPPAVDPGPGPLKIPNAALRFHPPETGEPKKDGALKVDTDVAELQPEPSPRAAASPGGHLARRAGKSRGAVIGNRDRRIFRCLPELRNRCDHGM